VICYVYTAQWANCGIKGVLWCIYLIPTGKEEKILHNLAPLCENKQLKDFWTKMKRF